ncbi:hypothetical protein MmiHf6_08970 [Methanimicrococcus hongohii]|uniref:Uncharacterized protein n=1 Tax=Methanimicrococcus hongohii TaxID=3028295 RepID=A0AA97A1W4_9EURY|nr:hypothetical protein MmiHf6_08970 [Methanimicrococcus sp. Hf6]
MQTVCKIKFTNNLQAVKKTVCRFTFFIISFSEPYFSDLDTPEFHEKALNQRIRFIRISFRINQNISESEYYQKPDKRHSFI